MIELEKYIVKANPDRATKTKTKRVPVLDSFSFSLERKYQPYRTTETEPTRVPVLDSFSFSLPFSLLSGAVFRRKRKRGHVSFSCSFGRNVGYDPTEIFSTNHVLYDSFQLAAVFRRKRKRVHVSFSFSSDG